MSTDRSAVVWTRLNGVPRKMGQLYVTDRECRFTYDEDYLTTGQPGLGLVYDPVRRECFSALHICLLKKLAAVR